MARVLEECDSVAADFSPDPVHDLRVALRRCRSMADGLMAIVLDSDWKKMKRAGKRLFQKLGDLRDTQVMMEWVEKLDSEDARVAREAPVHSHANSGAVENFAVTPDVVIHNPVSQDILKTLSQREIEYKSEAQARLEALDRKQ